MSEQSNQQLPDFMGMWRTWLTESERQLNAFFGQMMGSDEFSRSAGGFLEMYAASQRLMAENMERYLAFINVPSRTDIIALGETLRSIETRLSRIEETLQLAAAAIDSGGEAVPLPLDEPRRTRRPGNGALPELPVVEPAAVPEPFRANIR